MKRVIEINTNGPESLKKIEESIQAIPEELRNDVVDRGLEKTIQSAYTTILIANENFIEAESTIDGGKYRLTFERL